MTALSRSSIPPGINTYERLAVWAMQCLQNIANGQQVNVIEGQGQVPQAQVQLGVRADNVTSFYLSAYIPVDLPALNSPTQKTWMSAVDIATAAPHSNFLSD